MALPRPPVESPGCGRGAAIAPTDVILFHLTRRRQAVLSTGQVSLGSGVLRAERIVDQRARLHGLLAPAVAGEQRLSDRGRLVFAARVDLQQRIAGPDVGADFRLQNEAGAVVDLLALLEAPGPQAHARQAHLLGLDA